MSRGFQLFVGEDGSQILVDTNTGKSYKLVESDTTESNAIEPNHLQHYENFHNSHKPTIQQGHINGIREPHPQLAELNDGQQLYPNLMLISPNRIHAPEPATTHKSVLARPTSQFGYEIENTSTPTRTEQEQDRNGRNSNMNNNKRLLNESDEYTTVLPRRGGKKNQKTHDYHQSPRLTNANNMTNTDSAPRNNQNKYTLPFEQLQRAVAHHLPCFVISFSDTENLPSAVSAAEEILDHFIKHEIKLNSEFSIVRYSGNQLRVGVRDKNDYVTLCKQEIWPKEIKNKQVTIHIPKFIPEQFSLVVRYIPSEIPIEEVGLEVKRSASTAGNFRKIIYSYPRKTADYRFTVADLKEYNGLLRLGHIGIGNKMRVVTPYLPANKITYCSKCWKLGHLRHQCKADSQKCRTCLMDFNESHNQICSKKLNCAQCGLDHFSLDADCQRIQEYRNNLNRAVKQAVGDGALKLKSITRPKVTIPLPPELNSDNYPSIIPLSKNTVPATTPTWINNRTTSLSQRGPDLTNQQLLEQMKIFMDGKIERIETQLIQMKTDTSENKKAVENVHVKLSKVVNITKTLLEVIIKPIVSLIPDLNDSLGQVVESLIADIKLTTESIQEKSQVQSQLQTTNQTQAC